MQDIQSVLQWEKEVIFSLSFQFLILFSLKANKYSSIACPYN